MKKNQQSKFQEFEHASSAGRIPPHEPIVEKTIVGSIINYPERIPEIMAILLPEDFYSPMYQTAYGAIIHLYTNGTPIDLITVTQRLKETGDLGSETIMELTDATTIGVLTSLKHYAKVLVDRSVTRKLISGATAIANKGYDAQANVDELLADIDTLTMETRSRFVENKTVHISEATSQVNGLLQRIYDGKHLFEIKFGLTVLDRITGGIEPDDMVVIAGKEKSGKTTMALQVALENAKAKNPVQIFSQEMTISKLFLRLAIIESDISWLEALEGRLSPVSKQALGAAIKRISKLPIYVNDNMNSPSVIRSQVDLYKENFGTKLVIVDYIQIVKPDVSKYDTREREIADISSKMKTMAKEFRIPVIVVSAVNEDMKVRESRAVQYDMDKMITIMREDEKIDKDNDTGIIEVDLGIRQRMSLSGMGALKVGYKLKTGAWVNLYQGETPDSQQEEIF